jgi:hypothetical protein
MIFDVGYTSGRTYHSVLGNWYSLHHLHKSGDFPQKLQGFIVCISATFPLRA